MAKRPQTKARRTHKAARSQRHLDMAAIKWGMLEAKNLLRCVSIATDYQDSVSDDLRPSIGVAIDGVARLLDSVASRIPDDMEVANG